MAHLTRYQHRAWSALAITTALGAYSSLLLPSSRFLDFTPNPHPIHTQSTLQIGALGHPVHAKAGPRELPHRQLNSLALVATYLLDVHIHIHLFIYYVVLSSHTHTHCAGSPLATGTGTSSYRAWPTPTGIALAGRLLTTSSSDAGAWWPLALRLVPTSATGH